MTTIQSFSRQIAFFTAASFIIIAAFVLHANFAYAAQMPVLNSPLSGESFSVPMPEISGTASGADKVMVIIDDVLNGTANVAQGSFIYYPFIPLASGPHTIQLRAKNSQTGQISGYTTRSAFYVIPNPSPTLLAPEQGKKLGQDRAWVGGVAKNNSLIRVFVDNQEYARTKVKNHVSGIGSFGVNLPGLALGKHVVTAIARDQQGKDSFLSNSITINILPATPAPIVKKIVVNADAGIERPFIAGVAKNNLEVSIVIDGRVVHRMPLGSDPSGVISFAWQPEKPLLLGKHKIEAFASDKGKLSNNSEAVFWQVGEAQAAEDNKISGSGKVKAGGTSKAQELPPEEPAVKKDSGTTLVEDDKGEIMVVEGEDRKLVVSKGEESKPLTVKDGLKEEPVVPDAVPEEGAVAEPEKEEGRISADDDKLALSGTDTSVEEIAPGAVVKKVNGAEGEGRNFTLNTSLVIGIVILVFLLLSILVWYIQEKKENLGQKVVDMFREEDEGAKDQGQDASQEGAPDKTSRNIDVKFEEEAPKKHPSDEFEWPEEPSEEPPKEQFPPKEDDDESKRRPEDLPPPPPPMF